MQRLEITGETPEALYLNVIQTLSLFLRGPQQTMPVDPAKDAASATVAEPDIPGVGSNPAAAGQEVIPPKTSKRGAKAKVDKLPDDDISDVGGHPAGKTIEHEPQKLTLDGDIRPRLRAIQKACTDRHLDMAATVAYVQKLYGPFGIAKAEQLKPEQFAEFLEMSDAYLSGEA